MRRKNMASSVGVLASYTALTTEPQSGLVENRRRSHTQCGILILSNKCAADLHDLIRELARFVLTDEEPED